MTNHQNEMLKTSLLMVSPRRIKVSATFWGMTPELTTFPQFIGLLRISEISLSEDISISIFVAGEALSMMNSWSEPSFEAF